MSRNPNFRIIFAFIYLILGFLDWWSKHLADLREVTVFNQGGVLGILPSKWWIVVVLVWFWVINQWRKEKNNQLWLGLGLVVTGGFGNILDRILYGGVRDFIYYPGLRFYGNLADIYLAIGVIWLLLYKKKSINSVDES